MSLVHVGFCGMCFCGFVEALVRQWQLNADSIWRLWNSLHFKFTFLRSDCSVLQCICAGCHVSCPVTVLACLVTIAVLAMCADYAYLQY